ncbi:MAG: FAD-dependent oxidoreductase [Thermoleophilia bacterium]|nr:FAD-dependent oxidoreductase [Thermoleophilia bacterium]
MNTSTIEPTRVIIVGGGVAALEAMLALREFGGDRVTVDLFAPRKDFKLKPLGVSEAFGHGEVLTYDLDSLASNAGATFHMQSVASVDPEHRRVLLHDNSELSYDYLVVATGTKALWAVPGAKTFWGLHGQEVISELLDSLDITRTSRVLLTMPDPAVWPLPIYELALYLATEFREGPEPRPTIGIVTPESAPLKAFGEAVSDQVEAMLEESSVDLVSETTPTEFANGLLETSGDSIPADVVLTLPRLIGRRIDGLPFDDDGFLPVNELGLVQGCDREYAAGDVISYPIKFGGAATEQADVVASAIAAKAWDAPEPEPFVPNLRATLLTAEGPVPLGPQGSGSDQPGTEPWTTAQKVRGKFLTPVLTAAAAQKKPGDENG